MKLKVYPNPWGINPKTVESGKVPAYASVDAQGRPCGVVLNDINRHRRNERSYVGASVDPKRTTQTGKRTELRAPSQETVFAFNGVSVDEPEFVEKLAATEAIELPVTPYYLDTLQRGQLIPADDYTASVAGYKRTPDYPTLLLELEELAARSFNAQRSQFAPSYEELRKRRTGGDVFKIEGTE